MRERGERIEGLSASFWPVAVKQFPSLTVATPRLDVRPLDAEDSGAVA
jgi:hypothetical protein